MISIAVRVEPSVAEPVVVQPGVSLGVSLGIGSWLSSWLGLSLSVVAVVVGQTVVSVHAGVGVGGIAV